MNKIILILLSLAAIGCEEYSCIQTTPFSTCSNISSSSPKIQNNDRTKINDQPQAEANKSQTLSTSNPNVNNQNNFPVKPQSTITQSIININPEPIYNCNVIPTVPANYFVTYESINDYPVTYKAKYIGICIRY